MGWHTKGLPQDVKDDITINTLWQLLHMSARKEDKKAMLNIMDTLLDLLSKKQEKGLT